MKKKGKSVPVPFVKTNRGSEVEASWNVMAHAQKPDFVFRRNRRVHLNRRRGPVQLTTGSRGVRISGSNAGYTMFRGRVKGTVYPLHSPVSPSLPVRHRVPSHFNWSVKFDLYVSKVSDEVRYQIHGSASLPEKWAPATCYLKRAI